LFSIVFDQKDAGVKYFFNDPKGFGAFKSSVHGGFDMLMQVLLAPEPEGYYREKRADGTEWLQSNRDYEDKNGTPVGAGTKIPLIDGRYYSTEWDGSAGYYWFDKIIWAGYFYDKMLAMELISDPTTYFMGRDTSVDARLYAMNLYTLFPDEIDRAMGAMLSEDYAHYAPVVTDDGHGQLVYPRFSTGKYEPPAGSVPINPKIDFTAELYLAVYGLTYFTRDFDMHFLELARIWVTGAADEIKPKGTLKSFTDPWSQQEYNAISVPDADGKEIGIGARMIDHANVLLARYKGQNEESDDEMEKAGGELRLFLDNLNLVRSIAWHQAYTQY
jgi:hypothetical protein